MKKLFNINLDVLKLIALLSMTIDHIGHILFPEEISYRIIGRLSFPLFAFLITTHLVQKNLFKKYIYRILFFGIISSILITPFKAYFYESFTLNILWSFFLSISALMMIEKIWQEKTIKYFKYIMTFFVILIGGYLALLTDYETAGFIYTLSLYGFLKTKNKYILASCLVFAFMINFSGYNFNLPLALCYAMTGFLTTIFLLLQKQPPHQPQVRFLKPWWLFYLYFPIHIVVLFILKIRYFM